MYRKAILPLIIALGIGSLLHGTESVVAPLPPKARILAIAESGLMDLVKGGALDDAVDEISDRDRATRWRVDGKSLKRNRLERAVTSSDIRRSDLILVGFSDTTLDSKGTKALAVLLEKVSEKGTQVAFVAAPGTSPSWSSKCPPTRLPIRSRFGTYQAFKRRRHNKLSSYSVSRSARQHPRKGEEAVGFLVLPQGGLCPLW